MFSLESIRRLSFIRVACLLLVVFAALFAGPAAFAFSTTFTGNVDNDWTKDGNWSNNAPDSSVDAIIPYNKAPVIPASYTTAAAKTLTINVSGGTRGSVTLANGSVLTLGNGTATSTIHGDLIIGDDNGEATLKIDGTHTIQGEGGTIQLYNNSSEIHEKDSSGDSLVVKSSSIACDADNPVDRDHSLLVHGNGHIQVEMQNCAYVVADGCLRLTGKDKTGTKIGHWMAENHGELHVECHVVGACEWKIVDLSNGGDIMLTDSQGGCVRASGNVTLWNGNLSCGTNTMFCTTGKLIWQSKYENSVWSQPFIYTTSTSSATFGLGGASTCSTCP